MKLFVFITLLLIVNLTYQICDIKLVITRSENIPDNLYVQVERSDKKISKLIKLKSPTSRRRIKIKYHNCLEQKVRVTSLKTLKDEYTLVDRKEALIDGIGSITYKIEEDGKISIPQRRGIICMFGDCGNASG
uniref:NTR domain-containing protein n=1 Tax=Strongyloides venezuelensis TaxID=75913 RepID=A0A0K0FCY0_STRVS